MVRGTPLGAHVDPDRWYHLGISTCVAMLQTFAVVDEDVGTVPRDPIAHFRKIRSPALAVLEAQGAEKKRCPLSMPVASVDVTTRAKAGREKGPQKGRIYF